MESLVSTFHIDLQLLIAQAVNFGIVLAVLYFFALKPLVNIMNERSEKIAKSLEEADAVSTRLKEAETEKEEIVSAAKKQASIIVEEAVLRGEEKREAVLTRAKEEIGQLINSEKAKIQTEKAETLKEIKADVAELVILTVEKVLNEKMNSERDQELIKKLAK